MVLEQRIGRIYRLGQKKNVRLINLVARGTIDERMPDVLRFKRGVAAGILDGGDNSIFPGEDKFKQLLNQLNLLQPVCLGLPLTLIPWLKKINTEKDPSIAANEASQKDLFEEEIMNCEWGIVHCE